MQTIDFLGGTHIDEAAKQLVEAAKVHGSAKARFNGINLTATPDSVPQEISALYQRECEAQAKAWRESPEGQAALRAENEERKSLQAKHDRLMRRLPFLDWSSDVAVIDWISGMEGLDRSDIIVRRDTIVSAFEARGFKAGENTGAAYREEDRTNSFRWLVGQAVDGLKNGPAIHPIWFDFADKWRKRFGASPRNTE